MKNRHRQEMASPLVTPLIEVLEQAGFLPDDASLGPLEVLLGRSDPSDDELAAYAENWRQEPPNNRDEFANLLNASDEQ